LLVEDHESTRLAIGKLLELHGATVEKARDAREGLRALTHWEPQVLLLDLMLPDMDGLEVLKKLQDRKPDSLKCVLAVSDRVAVGRFRPTAPTDPYVRTLAHTVPRVMVSLRA
jgi:CheY-like chemotaxis protein